ncbi:MAG: murein biosynthesis integral membrane protein MurJ, partial [Verrucomicrobiae bacterium]|nr:murein biosynthesis integral membrane protein MurJ [Verrucomicrobiae bacterium]
MTKSAGVVGVAIAISRVMGLIRDQVFAYFFGATPIADAFILAFRIPNLLRDLFAEGALSQAYVPTFTKVLMQKGEKAAWRLTNLVLNWQIAILSAITVIGMIFAPQLVTLLANTGRHAGSSFSDPQILNLAILLTQIMFPFIILVAMAAVFMGTLNVKHIFFIPASASTMFNITSVVFGCIFGYWIYRDAPRAAVVGWAVGTLAGGFTQAAVQVPSLWRLGWRYEFRFAGPDSGLSDVIKRVIPGIIAVSPVQVNVLVSTWFAASLEAGSVAWLSYAFRLIFLPIGLFGVG